MNTKKFLFSVITLSGVFLAFNWAISDITGKQPDLDLFIIGVVATAWGALTLEIMEIHELKNQ